MLISQLIMAPLMILLAWGHVRMRPPVVRGTGMRLFDGSVIMLGVVLCALADSAVSGLPLAGKPEVWRPVFANRSTFVVFPTVLFLGWWPRDRVYGA